MGSFDRFGRVIRSNISHWESENTDPEIVVSEAVQDLTQSIIRLQQSIAVAELGYNNLETLYRQTLAEVLEWNQKVDRAKQKNRLDLVKEASIREQGHKQKAVSQNTQLKQQKISLDLLKANLQELKGKLSEIQSRKNNLVSGTASFNATERLERLGDLELQQRPRAKMETDFASLSVEEQSALVKAEQDKEFELLKASLSTSQAIDPIDEQIEALRAELRLHPFVDPLDEELETLRKQLEDL